MADIGSVQYLNNLYKTTANRNAAARQHEAQSWRMYGGQQFDDKVLAQLRAEGRPPHTFNFSKNKIDTLVGSSLADAIETKFATELGDPSDYAMLVNEHFLEDKDLGGWRDVNREFLRAGFVHRGIKELFVDRKHDPRGRLNWRYWEPSKIQVDPDWRSNRVSDNKQLFTLSWMSPIQIGQTFKKKSHEIQNAIDLWKNTRDGKQSSTESDPLFDLSPEVYDQQNGLFLVVQCLELRTATSYDLFDPATGDWMSDRDEDEAMLLEAAASVNGTGLEKLPNQKKILWVTTFAPGLSLNLKLEDAKHELQIGAYPFLFFSSDNVHGTPVTSMDALSDVQEAFNKRESVITHIMMTNANNGMLVEDDVFEDDAAYDDFVARKARPGATFKVPPGTVSQKKIAPIGQQTVPQDFFEAPNRMKEIADYLTPAVPAIQGQNDGSESGVKYQSKIMQAKISQMFVRDRLLALAEEEGSLYFDAFKLVYSGAPRRLVSSKSKRVWDMNVAGGINVADIPRLKVTVTVSQSSETVRRMIAQDLIALQPYVSNSPAMAAGVARVLISTVPDIPDDARKELEELARIDAENAKLQAVAMQLQAQIQIMGLQQQLQQTMMMQSMGGMGGPGVPGQPPGMQAPGGAPGLPAPPPRGPTPAMQRLQGVLSGKGNDDGQDIQGGP